MGTEHEEHSFLMIKDKNLSQIKADLIHAFLCVRHLLLLACFSLDLASAWKYLNLNIKFKALESHWKWQ